MKAGNGMLDGNGVRGLIAEVLGVRPDAVTDQLAFQSIPEWDSLGHVNLMVRLENELDVLIEEEQMVELTSLSAIEAFVRSRSSRT